MLSLSDQNNLLQRKLKKAYNEIEIGKNSINRNKEIIDCLYNKVMIFEIIYNDMVNIGSRMAHKDKSERDLRYSNGSYDFIPKSADNLYNVFHYLSEWFKKEKITSRYSYSFLDAGCGIGNVLRIANAMKIAYKYIGIEYYQNAYDAAKQFLGIKEYPGCFKLIKADILKYKNYGNYDIIYYFCPFSNHRKEEIFEERIENQAKIGAIIIPFNKQSSGIFKDDRFKQLDLGDTHYIIFQKISNLKQQA